MQKHCSFGFVIFLDKKVVVASMENMDNAELYGCVLTVNYAPTEGIKGGEQGWSPNPDRSVAVLPRSVLHQCEPPVWRPVNVEQLITITEQ
ncbi:hypothetical protein CASFOL_025189 [Castilleja foliolosa]|uniref:Uncharacterized protein n=1 Tax=Castilleja foliolosa TaxID=1961234 RepID=A0ABD3CQH1_9LAMI